jgi:hypothetical protein
MGIMTRRQGTEFVISSDRGANDAPTSKAPKGRPSENYEVWNGDNWSTISTDAKTFDTLDAADDYVRANFSKVTGLRTAPPKPRVKRPSKPAPPAPDVTAPNADCLSASNRTIA